MTVYINPGSGPVANATEDSAAANIKVFADDIALKHGVEVVDIRRKPDDDDRGRYGFVLGMADGRKIDVEMPGIPLEGVRYIGADDQNIWDFPRLYIDGLSWVWEFAVNVCEPEEES